MGAAISILGTMTTSSSPAGDPGTSTGSRRVPSGEITIGFGPVHAGEIITGSSQERLGETTIGLAAKDSWGAAACDRNTFARMR